MVLFLDYDGVLHPDEAYHTKRGVVLRCDGHDLFEHAQLLADLLDPYPHVKIVLSTSWVFQLGFSTAKARLPAALQAKIKGATFHSQFEERHLWTYFTRHKQISTYVIRHRLTDWIALDDDDDQWPDEERHRLVHTNEWGGIGDRAAQDELIAKLAKEK